MKKKEVILVKLGGSLITDKKRPYTPRRAVIKRLAAEIKSAWDRGYRFIVCHGSGSFGHTSAAKYKTAEGIRKRKDCYGLAVVQQDALAINRIVNKIFLESGLPCLSFVPSSFIFAQEKKREKLFVEPIIQALKIEALPLVFGDVVLDRKRGCCIFSGERILEELVPLLLRRGFGVKRVIHCGITQGVYDSKGRIVPLLDKKTFSSLRGNLRGAAGVDVTGGMFHKIEVCLRMAELGVESFIIDGRKKGNLLKTILGEEMLETRVVGK